MPELEIHTVGGGYYLYDVFNYLAAFTGFYALHLVAYEPPDCECFLKLEAFAQWRGAVTGVIPRNLVLLAIWAVGCVPIGFRPRPAVAADSGEVADAAAT